MTSLPLRAWEAACAGLEGVALVERIARDGSGAGAAERLFAYAGGLAERAQGIAMTVDTRLGVASATKGFTAVTVLGLAAEGVLHLDEPVRAWLGDDLPLIGSEVTIEQLLTHRSGIGDYVDEAAGPAPLRVPVQELDSTSAYLPALDGFPAVFPPGTAFRYCNSGYVVLALIAERAAGAPFAELVQQRVFAPAAMTDSGFFRSDALPSRAFLGYLEDGRTNVFALPLTGSGDGGAYSTAPDLTRFWAALYGGRLLPASEVERMTRAQVVDTGNRHEYGTGLWVLADSGLPFLDGCDLGVSARSLCDPATGTVVTVLANTTDGAWQAAAGLRDATFAGA